MYALSPNGGRWSHYGVLLETSLPPNPPPLFGLYRPTEEAIEHALAQLGEDPFSYDEVGATETGEAPEWPTHRHEVLLGSGQALFERTAEAIRTWVPFDLPWVALHDPGGPPMPGQLVAFSSRQLGIWAFNICRVIYVIDQRDPEGNCWRYGFAYGTLKSHAVRGEERFMASWDRDADEVKFQISKFSQGRNLLVRASGPVARTIQVRFSQDALARVQSEVEQ